MAEVGSPKLSPGISSQQELAQRLSANSSAAVSTSSGQSAPPQLETSSSQLQSSPQRLLQTQQQLTPQQQHSITNHLTMQQQNRNAAAAALRNLAPRQQVPIGTEIMRMMNSIPPQGVQSRQLHVQPQQHARGVSQQMVQVHQIQQMGAGRVIAMNAMQGAGQGPQQLIPIGMRMVPNGTQSHESLTQVSVAAPIQLMSTPMQQLMPSGTRMQHNSMVRLVQHQSDQPTTTQNSTAQQQDQQSTQMSPMRPVNTCFIVPGANGSMMLSTSMPHMHSSGVMPQNLVPVGVGIAQSISGLQQMHVQQQQQQLMLQQQKFLSSANRGKKRRTESGEMSVGEYLALGMEDKNRVEETESPDASVEAPPALDRGDSVDDSEEEPTVDMDKYIEAMFVREGLAFRARVGGGKNKTIVHELDGFTIEEGDSPFPLSQYDQLTRVVSPDVLEDLMPRIADIDVKKEVEDKSSSRRRSHRLAVTESKQKEEQKKRVTRQRRSTVEDMSEMGKGDGVKIEVAELDEPKRRRGRPPTGSVSNPIRRRTNELDALLSMDFGPKDSGRRILDSEKRKSVAEREAQDKCDEYEEQERSRSRQKRKSSQMVESPSKCGLEPKKERESPRKNIGDKLLDSEHMCKVEVKSEDSLSTPKNSKFSLTQKQEESPEERCLFCDVSFREKDRSTSHPQYCSSKCRRSYMKNEAQIRSSKNFSDSLRRISGGECSSFSSCSSTSASASSDQPDSHLSINNKKVKGKQEKISPKKEEPLTELPRSKSRAETVLTSVVDSGLPTTPPNSFSLNQLIPVSSLLPSSAALQSPERSTMEENDARPTEWTPEEVAQWALSVTGSEACASIFRHEEIDGTALLMLNADDIRMHLRFKFGPAKKIEDALNRLRSAMKTTENCI